MKSWKTTIGGALIIAKALITAVQLLTDGDVSTNPDLNSLMTEIMIGVTVMMAKDFNVSGSNKPPEEPKP